MSDKLRTRLLYAGRNYPGDTNPRNDGILYVEAEPMAELLERLIFDAEQDHELDTEAEAQAANRTLDDARSALRQLREQDG